MVGQISTRQRRVSPALNVVLCRHAGAPTGLLWRTTCTHYTGSRPTGLPDCVTWSRLTLIDSKLRRTCVYTKTPPNCNRAANKGLHSATLGWTLRERKQAKTKQPVPCNSFAPLSLPDMHAWVACSGHGSILDLLRMWRGLTVQSQRTVLDSHLRLMDPTLRLRPEAYAVWVHSCVSIHDTCEIDGGLAGVLV